MRIIEEKSQFFNSRRMQTVKNYQISKKKKNFDGKTSTVCFHEIFEKEKKQQRFLIAVEKRIQKKHSTNKNDSKDKND